MSIIEISAPQQAPSEVIVHTGTNPLDYASAAQRYVAESMNPDLTKHEKWAKRDTANALVGVALREIPTTEKSDLQERVQEYLGNKTPTSR